MLKVQLSAKELELVTDAEWVLTKQSIVDKVFTLFGAISDETKKLSNGFFDEQLTQQNAKISRGENYLGLPYIMMDFPRWFAKDEICAIRIMFWWAKYFSITLHVKGKYRDKVLEKLDNDRVQEFAHFYIFSGVDEWAHEIEETNYTPISTIDLSELDLLSHQHDFLKIAYKLPLTDWDNAFEILLKRYSELLDLLQS